MFLYTVLILLTGTSNSPIFLKCSILPFKFKRSDLLLYFLTICSQNRERKLRTANSAMVQIWCNRDKRRESAEISRDAKAVFAFSRKGFTPHLCLLPGSLGMQNNNNKE